MGVTYHMVGVFPALTLRHLDWFELDPSIKTRGMQRFPDHFSSLHRLASLYALMMRRFEEKEKLCSNSSSYSQVGSPQFAKCVSPPSLFSSSSAPLLWMPTSTRFDPLSSLANVLVLVSFDPESLLIFANAQKKREKQRRRELERQRSYYRPRTSTTTRYYFLCVCLRVCIFAVIAQDVSFI